MLRITMRAVFREETTHRAELSDFRRIVVGHSGVGVAGGRRSGGGKSGAGHLGVALACVFSFQPLPAPFTLREKGMRESPIIIPIVTAKRPPPPPDFSHTHR